MADDEEHVLVAYQHDKPVAVWSVMPLEVSSQHRGVGRPERAAFLGFAVDPAGVPRLRPWARPHRRLASTGPPRTATR